MEIRWVRSTPPEPPGRRAEVVLESGTRTLGTVPEVVFEETDVDAMRRHLAGIVAALERTVDAEDVRDIPPRRTLFRQIWHPFRLPHPPRDAQQHRVYAAEHSLESDGRGFATVGECQAFVDHVLFSGYWRRRFPRFNRVRVKDGRGRRHGVANKPKREILLPRVSRTERTILHELAHIVTPLRHAGHGPEFAAHYADLVREFLGDGFARELLLAFETHGVAVAGRTRQMTLDELLPPEPDQRASSPSSSS